MSAKRILIWAFLGFLLGLALQALTGCGEPVVLDTDIAEANVVCSNLGGVASVRGAWVNRTKQREVVAVCKQGHIATWIYERSLKS